MQMLKIASMESIDAKQRFHLFNHHPFVFADLVSEELLRAMHEPKRHIQKEETADLESVDGLS